MTKALRLSRGPAFLFLLATAALPLAARGASRVLFQDGFQDNRYQWPEGDKDRLSAKFAGGRYAVKLEGPAVAFMTKEIPITYSEDFELTANVRAKGKPGSACGLAWAAKDGASASYFLITNDGRFSVVTLSEGKALSVIEWTKAESINQFGRRNRLVVRKAGAAIEYLVNDSIVGKSAFEEPSQGTEIGFAFSEGVSAELDNLIVNGSYVPRRAAPKDAAGGVEKPALVVQTGHAAPVRSLGFSADGKLLATASSDRTVKLWDVSVGRELRTFKAHAVEAGALAISPRGEVLASAGKGFLSGELKLLDLASGDELATLAEGPFTIGAVAFSPDGALLAAASGTSAVQMLAGGSTSREPRNVIRLWEVASRKPAKVLRGHDLAFVDIAFSPDGLQLASVARAEYGKESELQLWDVAGGAYLRTLKDAPAAINAIRYGPDAASLIAACDDGVVRVLDTATGRETRAFTDGSGGAIKAVALSPDGRKLASGGLDTKVWDYQSGRLLQTIDKLSALGENLHKYGGQDYPVLSLAFSPDSKLLAMPSGNAIRIEDVESLKELRRLDTRSPALTSVAVGRQGALFASLDTNQRIRLWDVANAREQSQLYQPEPAGRAAFVSLDAQGSILAQSQNDGAILWDLKTQKPLRAVGGGKSATTAGALSPDGSLLAIGGEDGLVRIIDVKTGADARALKVSSTRVNFVSFSRGGELIATNGEGNSLSLWNTKSGGLLGSLAGHTQPVYAAAFSSDSRFLASASWDGTVKLWDASSGKELNSFAGHTGGVFAVVFSPDGKLIASGGDDNLIKIWSIGSGRELLSLKGHSNQLIHLSYGEDGKTLTSASKDGVIKIWNAAEGAEVATFAGVGEHDYVVATADGHYTSSRSASRGVAFRFHNRAYPFEQFDLRLNRPDLVLARIGRAPAELVGSYRRAHEKRLSRMGFTENMLGDSFALPEVAILAGNTALSTRAKTLRLKVRASDASHDLDRLLVFINDVPVFGARGLDLRPLQARRHERALDLELSAGKNKIQVSALNANGVESLKETFDVIYDGPVVTPDLYLVTIGVSRYRDARYNLTYAAKDAKDLAALVAGRVPGVKTLTLLDEQATRENILAAKQFLSRSKVDDRVIVFVAGHGLLSGNLDYYLATTDVDFENPAARGLDYAELEGLLDGIPARKKLLLVDACNSGEVDKEGTVLAALAAAPAAGVSSRGFKMLTKTGQGALGLKSSFELLQELFADLRRGSGAMVISAASGTELAFESAEWKNGVFTYSLLDGLRDDRADANKDGHLTVSELRAYVIDKVKALTGGRQTPTSRQENLEYDFDVF